MGNEGQKRSLKWCRRTRRFLRAAIGKAWRWFNSIGTTVGNLPADTGLCVDHAKLWAEPHATRLIFLPESSQIFLANFSLYFFFFLPSSLLLGSQNTNQMRKPESVWTYILVNNNIIELYIIQVTSYHKFQKLSSIL